MLCGPSSTQIPYLHLFESNIGNIVNLFQHPNNQLQGKTNHLLILDNIWLIFLTKTYTTSPSWKCRVYHAVGGTLWWYLWPPINTALREKMYIRNLQLFCTETKYISYLSQHKTATMIFALQPSHLTRNNHIFISHSGCKNYKSMILSHLTFSSEWYNINQHLHILARKIVYTGQRAICRVFTGSLIKCTPHGLVNVIVNINKM